jgi:DNA-binding winged helix-turn-helix (wHTH) protein
MGSWSTENPQFLETVVGKGYRFVGNVTVSGQESPPLRAFGCSVQRARSLSQALSSR